MRCYAMHDYYVYTNTCHFLMFSPCERKQKKGMMLVESFGISSYTEGSPYPLRPHFHNHTNFTSFNPLLPFSVCSIPRHQYFHTNIPTMREFLRTLFYEKAKLGDINCQFGAIKIKDERVTLLT